MPGPIASRQFRDNEANAIINALDKNNDKIIGRNELYVTDPSRFRRMDTNGDGRLQAYEAKDALKLGLISNITFNGDRAAAVQVLLKFDSNQDGILQRNEFDMTGSAVRAVDGYGSRKYSYENGQRVYDDKNRVRSTGAAYADGQISISELANALADNQFVIGDALYHR
jgi:hypothetical protein